MLNNQFNLIELYAGTARSSEPFRKWKKCKISLLVDQSPIAAAIYLANFSDAPYVIGDLSRITPVGLLGLAGCKKVDILVGCPPCQGFSDTGLREPFDPRNAHLERFSIFAQALKPLAVVMENVPLAAGTAQLKRFIQRMEKEGYAWTAGILNAVLWGSVQCRQRLVFIGVRQDVGAMPQFPQPSHGGCRKYFSYRFHSMKSFEEDMIGMLGETPATRRVKIKLPYQEGALGMKNIPYLSEALEGLPRIGTPEADELSHYAWAHTSKQLRRMKNVPEGGRWAGGKEHFSQSYGRLHRLGLARTITTFFPNSGSGRFWHPIENRALTIREAARIQGFPDSFKFPPHGHISTLIGNALDSAIASVSFDVVKQCLQ